jgi:hypothetical protein
VPRERHTSRFSASTGNGPRGLKWPKTRTTRTSRISVWLCVEACADAVQQTSDFDLQSRKGCALLRRARMGPLAGLARSDSRCTRYGYSIADGVRVLLGNRTTTVFILSCTRGRKKCVFTAVDSTSRLVHCIHRLHSSFAFRTLHRHELYEYRFELKHKF